MASRTAVLQAVDANQSPKRRQGPGSPLGAATSNRPSVNKIGTTVLASIDEAGAGGDSYSFSPKSKAPFGFVPQDAWRPAAGGSTSVMNGPRATGARSRTSLSSTSTFRPPPMREPGTSLGGRRNQHVASLSKLQIPLGVVEDLAPSPSKEFPHPFYNSQQSRLQETIVEEDERPVANPRSRPTTQREWLNLSVLDRLGALASAIPASPTRLLAFLSPNEESSADYRLSSPSKGPQVRSRATLLSPASSKPAAKGLLILLIVLAILNFTGPSFPHPHLRSERVTAAGAISRRGAKLRSALVALRAKPNGGANPSARVRAEEALLEVRMMDRDMNHVPIINTLPSPVKHGVGDGAGTGSGDGRVYKPSDPSVGSADGDRSPPKGNGNGGAKKAPARSRKKQQAVPRLSRGRAKMVALAAAAAAVQRGEAVAVPLEEESPSTLLDPSAAEAQNDGEIKEGEWRVPPTGTRRKSGNPFVLNTSGNE